MYNKLNLSIDKITSKQSFKPELAAIAFYGDKTVATDSFRLLEVSAPGEKLEKPVLLNAKRLACSLKISKEDSLTIDEIVTRSGMTETQGTFPNYEQIMEPAFNREDDIKIKVNGKYLAEMVKILAGTNPIAEVELSIPLEKYQAITMTAKTSKKVGVGQTVRGLLMPMNK